jgi:hypothetical protein
MTKDAMPKLECFWPDKSSGESSSPRRDSSCLPAEGRVLLHPESCDVSSAAVSGGVGDVFVGIGTHCRPQREHSICQLNSFGGSGIARPQPGQPTTTFPAGTTGVEALTVGAGSIGAGTGAPSTVLLVPFAGGGINSRWPQCGQIVFRPADLSRVFSTLMHDGQANSIKERPRAARCRDGVRGRRVVLSFEGSAMSTTAGARRTKKTWR